MRIYTKGTLRDFWKLHPEAQYPLEVWYKKATKGDWKIPSDITDAYPNARIIANNRVIFNIKGNKYRLVVEIHYNKQKVYIRFVGTHSEYDKIDATTI